MASYAEDLARWVLATRFADLPDDVVEATGHRILDVIGLALAGLGTRFGESVRAAAIAIDGGGPARLLGTGERLGAATAALANGALSQAMEYDDTHNESIVHISGPSVAVGLALADSQPVSGRDLIAAVAIGNEVSCRIGSVAPGQFHKRGFHPTGLFAMFGATCLAGRLLGLDDAQLANAQGIAGSFASGILQCWVDGTQSKYLHPARTYSSNLPGGTNQNNGLRPVGPLAEITWAPWVPPGYHRAGSQRLFQLRHAAFITAPPRPSWRRRCKPPRGARASSADSSRAARP